MTPLDYSAVRDIYDPLKRSGVVQAPLESWASQMNDLTGDRGIYDAGLNDNWIKRGSLGLDRLIAKTGAPAITESFGRKVGGLIGAEEVGAELGRGMPRMAVDFAPMFIPFAGKAAIAANIVKYGGTGALSFANTYTRTDSPAAGAIAAATNMVMPGATNWAEQATLRAMKGTHVAGFIGKRLEDLQQFERWFPKNPLQGIASITAGQAVASGVGEVGAQGQNFVMTGSLHAPSWQELVLDMTLGQFPFAGLYLTKQGRAQFGGATARKTAGDLQKAVAEGDRVMREAQMSEMQKREYRLGQIPDVRRDMDSESEAQWTAKLQELRGVDTPKAKVELVKMLQQAPIELGRIGDLSKVARIDVAGVEVSNNGKYRLVAQLDENGQVDFEKPLLGYPIAAEPAPTEAEGRTVYHLPQNTINEHPWFESNKRKLGWRPPEEPNPQPELPQQESPAVDPITADQREAARVQREAEQRQRETEIKEADIESSLSRLERVHNHAELDAALREVNAKLENYDMEVLTTSALMRRLRKSPNVDIAKHAQAVVRREQQVARRVRAAEAQATERAETLRVAHETLEFNLAEAAKPDGRDLAKASVKRFNDAKAELAKMGKKGTEQLLDGELEILWYNVETDAAIPAEMKAEALMNRIRQQETKRRIAKDNIESAVPEIQSAQTIIQKAEVKSDNTALEIFRVAYPKLKDPESDFQVEQARFMALLEEGGVGWWKDMDLEFANDLNQGLAEIKRVAGFDAKVVTDPELRSPNKDKTTAEFRQADLMFDSPESLMAWANEPHVRRMIEVFEAKADAGGERHHAMVGQKAKLNATKINALETARTMRAAGRSSEDIRLLTGWYVNPFDGKLRFEVPDINAKLIKQDSDRLDAVLQHEELFTAYPELRNVSVTLAQMSSYGKWDRNNNRIVMNAELSKDDFRSTLIHEIQHAIQDLEGFAVGQALKSSEYHAISEQIKQLNRTPNGSIKAFTVGSKEHRSYKAKKGHLEAKQRRLLQQSKDEYLRSAGELEAREVQTRQNLTPEQLKELEPYSDQNIAPEDAIVKFKDERHHAPRIPAAPNFYWNFQNFDGKRIGKHPIPKNGMEDEAKFLKIAREDGKLLRTAELDFAKQQIPEAFVDGKVNVPLFYARLHMLEPVVRTEIYGQKGKVSEARMELDRMTHEWIDTQLLPQEVIFAANQLQSITPEGRVAYLEAQNIEGSMRDFALRYAELKDAVAADPSNTSLQATQFYNEISPFDIAKHPVIRIDVAAPTKKPGEMFDGQRLGPDEEGNVLWSQDDLHENLPNTLGWAMAQIVPDPKTGELVMFVAEQQSRWGQARTREVRDNVKDDLRYIGLHPGEVWDPKTQRGRAITKAMGESFWRPEMRLTEKNLRELYSKIELQGDAPAHPLLPLQHEIVLKAVVDEARKRGISRVVISDGQSAMMTEKHDTAARRIYTRQVDETRDYKPGDWGVREIRTNGEETFVPKPSKAEAEDFLRQRWPAGVDKFWKSAVVDQMTERDFIPIVSQSGGMLTHYNGKYWVLKDAAGKIIPDNVFNTEAEARAAAGEATPAEQTGRLVSTIQKLTGSKGEAWDGGVHKNIEEGWILDRNGVIEEHRTEQSALGSKSMVGGVVYKKGSPVFRNPDGTPKTNVTGLAFDISKAPEQQSLFNRVPRSEPFRKNAEGTKPFHPESPDDIATVEAVGRTGTSALEFLRQSSDPVTAEAVKILEAFPDALARVEVGFKEGYTAIHNNGFRLNVEVGYGDLRNRTTLDRGIAHELTHAALLTELKRLRSLDDPRFREIEALREDMIARLSPRLRAKFEEADVAGWSTTNPDFYLEGVTDQERAILYGLLNADEFTAQGMSSPEFQSWLRQQKVPRGKETLWQRFKSWTKRVLGVDEKNTAFDAMLEKLNVIGHSGNEVARVKTLLESRFINEGHNADVSMLMTQRALSQLEAMTWGDTSPLAVISALEVSGRSFEYNPQVKRTTAAVAELLANPDSPQNEIARQSLTEFGHAETPDGVRDFMLDAIEGFGNARDAVGFMPKQLTEYVFAKAKDFHDIAAALRDLSRADVAAMSNIRENAAMVHKTYGEVAKQLEDILKLREQYIADGTMLAQLEYMTPEGMFENIVHYALPDGAAEFLTEKRDSVGAIHKLLSPTAQLARSDSRIAEFVSKGYDMDSRERDFFRGATKILAIDLANGDFSSKALDQSLSVLKHAGAADAVNRWMFLNRKLADKEKRGATMLPMNHPEVQKLIGKFSPEMQGEVNDFVSRMVAVTRKIHENELKSMRQLASVRGAHLLVQDGTIKTEAATEVAGLAFDALTRYDMNDPAQQQQAINMLNAARAKVQNPDTWMSTYEVLTLEAQQFKLWQKFFDDNPAWVTARRLERYLVNYVGADGKRKKWQASSEKEAREFVKSKKGRMLDIVDQRAQNGDDTSPWVGADLPELFAALKQLEDNQYAILERNGVSPEILQQMREYSPVTQAQLEASQKRAIPDFAPPTARLQQGAEDLPFVHNHIAWAKGQAKYWSRRIYRAEADLLLNSPEFQQDDGLRQMMRTHRDNLMQGDPALGRFITKFNFTWLMGMSPASAMVNGSQSILTHVAEFTRMTGKPFQSYQKVLGGMGDVLHHYKTGTWKTPELTKFAEESTNRGEFERSMFDDNAAAQEAAETNLYRVLGKHKVKTLGQRIGTAAGIYSNVSMNMFKAVERFNQMTANVAAFQHHRKMGMDYDAAKKAAWEFNHAVNYAGGRNQRSIGLYSSRSDALRTVTMSATSLQTFVLGSTFQLARYLREGFMRPAGVSPAERHNARIAFVQMMATQFSYAGVLGLPFVSGLITIIDKLFPEAELNRKLREVVQNLFDQDEEDGSPLADIAMTGVPSLFGWDFSSRLSMGNSVPGSDMFNGFQVENLLGPSVRLGMDFASGARKLILGDTSGLNAFIPPAAKKIVRMVQTDGTIQDGAGRQLLTMTPGEKVGAVMGFNPKRASDMWAAQRIIQQSEQLATSRESSFRDQQGELVLEGQFGTVKAQLRQRIEEDEAFDAAAAIRSIARSAEEKAFMRDLRREGSQRVSSQREKILKMYRVEPDKASEVSRLQFRWQVQAALGMPQRNNGEIVMARMMDQLMTQNPTMTRSEARRIASERLHGPQIGPSLEE